MYSDNEKYMHTRQVPHPGCRHNSIAWIFVYGPISSIHLPRICVACLINHTHTRSLTWSCGIGTANLVIVFSLRTISAISSSPMSDLRSSHWPYQVSYFAPANTCSPKFPFNNSPHVARVIRYKLHHSIVDHVWRRGRCLSRVRASEGTRSIGVRLRISGIDRPGCIGACRGHCHDMRLETGELEMAEIIISWTSHGPCNMTCRESFESIFGIPWNTVYLSLGCAYHSNVETFA